MPRNVAGTTCLEMVYEYIKVNPQASKQRVLDEFGGNYSNNTIYKAMQKARKRIREEASNEVITTAEKAFDDSAPKRTKKSGVVVAPHHNEPAPKADQYIEPRPDEMMMTVTMRTGMVVTAYEKFGITYVADLGHENFEPAEIMRGDLANLRQVLVEALGKIEDRMEDLQMLGRVTRRGV